MTRKLHLLIIDRDQQWAGELADRLRVGLNAIIEVRPNHIQELYGRDTDHAYNVIILGHNVDPNFEHIRKLRAYYDERRLPVIVMDSDPRTEFSAMRYGANAFFNKVRNNTLFMQHLVTALSC